MKLISDFKIKATFPFCGSTEIKCLIKIPQVTVSSSYLHPHISLYLGYLLALLFLDYM